MPRSDPYDAASAAAPHHAEPLPPPFPGFRRPNYTPVPDELFDELLVELSGAELKVLLYVIRRTLGFKRDSDAISIAQMLNGLQTRDGRALDRGVGLTKKTLLLALRTLEERGFIQTERRQSFDKGNEPTIYRLNIRPDDGRSPEPDPTPTPPSSGGDEPSQEKSTPPLAEKSPQGVGEESTPPLGEFLPQGEGGKIPPGGRGKNSPTQKTELRETVEGQTVRGQTATGETARVSTGFELHAIMQQTGKPSRFSKTPRFDAFSQRDADEHSATSTLPDEPPPAIHNQPVGGASGGAAAGLTGRVIDGAAGADSGEDRPQSAPTASAPGAAHAAERPKTGRSGPKTAGSVSRATPPTTTPNSGPPRSSAAPRPAGRTGAHPAPDSAPRPARFQTSRRQPDAAHNAPATPPAGGTFSAAPRPRRAPPPSLSPYLEGLVTRYSEELHDEDHIPQNLGQAGRLWQASGWSEADFGQALHEAKTITVKRDIKKRAVIGGEFGARNKMPYYFKVLRDVLGLSARADAARPSGA